MTDDFEGNLENVGEESQEDLSDEDEGWIGYYTITCFG